MTKVPPRVLVLGLGNDALSDDAVGLHVAREVRDRLEDRPVVAVVESVGTGLTLLDEIVGCDRLVLIDAVQTGTVAPGTVCEWSLDAEPARRIAAPHSVGIFETIALGQRFGLHLPVQVEIVTVEVEDAATLNFGLTPSVQAAVNVAASRVVRLVKRWLENHPPVEPADAPLRGG